MTDLIVAYIDAEYMEANFGYSNPQAAPIFRQASLIVDQHVPYSPPHDDPAADYFGLKFPRTLSNTFATPDDVDANGDPLVPELVKMATAEQVIWMLSESLEFVRKGGNDALLANVIGSTKQRPRVSNPMLAPLAKLYLKSFMHRTGRDPKGLPGTK